MKILPFCLALSLVCASWIAADTTANQPSGNRIFVNGFRMPSIGLEYQRRSLSWHAGLYCTVVSKDKDGENETTWFGKTGMTWWPLTYLFVDASYLYGLNHDYRGDHGFMLNPGMQYLFRETVALRLGVAVLASPGHDFKINPTPGISFAVNL